jgi:hypothetical protein
MIVTSPRKYTRERNIYGSETTVRYLGRFSNAGRSDWRAYKGIRLLLTSVTISMTAIFQSADLQREHLYLSDSLDTKKIMKPHGKVA